MPIRRLPDLSPGQVVELQDALLANADALLTSALTLLDEGRVALAKSLAILGLEESGKAIAVHRRRVEIVRLPDGEPFRCDWLDELWGSHTRKLETVHEFLVSEPYWFGVEPADPEENLAYLGTIKAWSRRHDRSKQRGFYVDIGKTGATLAPADVADEGELRQVIAHVHQIGWQLRLGEHIEGKRQDEQEAGVPPRDEDDDYLPSLLARAWPDRSPEGQQRLAEIIEAARRGVPGEPLNNAAYRFNPPGAPADPNPFGNAGRRGYEAETRELARMMRDLGADASPRSDEEERER